MCCSEVMFLKHLSDCQVLNWVEVLISDSCTANSGVLALLSLQHFGKIFDVIPVLCA